MSTKCLFIGIPIQIVTTVFIGNVLYGQKNVERPSKLAYKKEKHELEVYQVGLELNDMNQISY